MSTMSVLVDVLSFLAFLANTALVAVCVVAGVSIFSFLAALLWLIVDDHRRRSANHAFSVCVKARRDAPGDALAETGMTTLAVDLATVETLTDVQAVSPTAPTAPTAPTSAFPLYTPPPSAPSLPSLPALPPGLPPVGSSMAVLDGRPDNAAAASNASQDASDANWPPQKPGAKTYRYIASMDGRLVRLRDLHRLELPTLSGWELN